MLITQIVNFLMITARLVKLNKFSSQGIVRKYLHYYEKKKDYEIPPFVKDLIENEEKLGQAVEDLNTLKIAFSEQDL